MISAGGLTASCLTFRKGVLESAPAHPVLCSRQCWTQELWDAGMLLVWTHEAPAVGGHPFSLKDRENSQLEKQTHQIRHPCVP